VDQVLVLVLVLVLVGLVLVNITAINIVQDVVLLLLLFF